MRLAPYLVIVLTACSSSSDPPQSSTPPDAGTPAVPPPNAPPPPPASSSPPPPIADAGNDATPQGESGDHVNFTLTQTGPQSLACISFVKKEVSYAPGCEHSIETDLIVVMNTDVGYVDVASPSPSICPKAGSFTRVDDIPTSYAGCTWYPSLPKFGYTSGSIVRDPDAGTHHWRVRIDPSIVATSLVVTVHFAVID